MTEPVAIRRRRRPGPLRGMISRAAVTSGCEVRAVPVGDLEAGPASPSIRQFTMTGPDPHFLLRWPGQGRLPAGRYRLIAPVPSGTRRLENPLLYVDSGKGFNDDEVISLAAASDSPHEIVADLDLSRGAVRLRFDPSHMPGPLAIGPIRLRRILPPEAALATARRGLERWRGAYRRGELLRRIGALVTGRGVPAPEPADPDLERYRRWIALRERFDRHAAAALREAVAALPERPLISVLMPTYESDPALLRAAIESVREQIYPDWELCIADDCSRSGEVRRILHEQAQVDPRIKVRFASEHGHIARTTNAAFALATGPWITCLDHDDILPPWALAQVALAIASDPDVQILYSDEDKLSRDGERHDPFFKPDYSRELLRSQNYFNHLTVHRAENVRAVGGWRAGFEGSQDYDLNLRIVERIEERTIRHIPKVLYHWRVTTGSTALAAGEKSYAFKAGLTALAEHAERLGLPATAEPAPGVPFYRLRYRVPEPPPLVSLIIPTRDGHDLLRTCVESIRERTTYPAYEILIVDNGSTDERTLDYMAALEAAGRARVLRYDAPFNYSAINNFAVRAARGSVLGLVNNDIEVISPGWLDEMVALAVLPDVGCVGAKLYYPDRRIQHAGVILGIGGVAGHSHKFFGPEDFGYFGRLTVLQNLSAVTGACLLVRRELYEAVGGLEEEHLPVAFNDVDLCLKVVKAGYRTVWTPYAELYHHESVSRGSDDSPEKMARMHREIAYMRATWELDRDPFYSEHLTRLREDFTIAG